MYDSDACFCPRTSRSPSMVLSGKALGVRKALQEMAVDPPGGLRDPEPAGLHKEGTCHPRQGPDWKLELI